MSILNIMLTRAWIIIEWNWYDTSCTGSFLHLAASLFSEIIIDFITNLLPCSRKGQVSNSILVLVDRYTKMAIYILSQIDWEAETIADVVVKTLLWKHGSLETFILDKASLFTAHYWKTFYAHLTIYFWYSTAFHPQTNGQIKQQN